jgi:hypothetical protein
MPARGVIIGSGQLLFARTMRQRQSPGTTRWRLGPGCGGSSWSGTNKQIRENEIDLYVLPELTADDLKELGVNVQSAIAVY